MSTGQYVAVGFVMPLLLLGAWIQTYRVWRRQADVSIGVVWFTGEAGGASLNSFLLPGVAGMTSTWLGVILEMAPDREMDPASAISVASWLMGTGFLMLLVGFWMWLFAWPRFLVPPHLRGRPGWVKAIWRQWRKHRQQRKEARA